MGVVTIIFWLSLILIFYIIIGYPIIMIIIPRFLKRTIVKADIEPYVSLIIAAYNEEGHIKDKIENSFLLDYPSGKLEIVVVSDGSNDKTNDIIVRYQDKGVRPIILKERVGKTKAQNIAATQAKGEILLFSDVTATFRPDVIKKMVRNFRDPSIGCVTGRILFSEKFGTNVGEGLNIYAKYQRFVKEKQSYHSLLSATGCIYAIRKELFEPVEKGLVNDLVIPLRVLERGFRVVYEDEALALVDRKIDLKDEFNRRTRIVLQGIRAIWSMRRLLNPFKYNFAISLISYRVLRWFLPILLILVFIANFLLINIPVYRYLFFAQFIFYIAAILGFWLELKGQKNKLLTAPFIFCLMNIAALVAIWRLMRGEKGVVWEPSRK